MTAQFSLFDLLMLIGITQGVVMSVLLFRSKNNKRSNPFLAFALLAFCWVSTKTLLHTLNLWDTQFFRYFPNSADVVIPPLVYLYFSSLVNGQFTLSRKHNIAILFIIFESVEGVLGESRFYESELKHFASISYNRSK